MNDYQLVLASGSPRRRELLATMGCDFSVYVSNTDESRQDNEPAQDFVCRLAQDKALAACAALSKPDKNLAILAADTVVVQGQTVFGKPSDYDDAQRIWQHLSGTQHQVMTAVCLQLSEQGVRGKIFTLCQSTEVLFDVITQAQMQRYWASGEPLDKAGAYAIQGLASAWVQQINGSYSNVVGLPLREVNDLLKKVNQNWL